LPSLRTAVAPLYHLPRIQVNNREQKKRLFLARLHILTNRAASSPPPEAGFTLQCGVLKSESAYD
jgi:hypothetical protein